MHPVKRGSVSQQLALLLAKSIDQRYQKPLQRKNLELGSDRTSPRMYLMIIYHCLLCECYGKTPFASPRRSTQK
jgi:hypothetical protein